MAQPLENPENYLEGDLLYEKRLTRSEANRRMFYISRMYRNFFPAGNRTIVNEEGVQSIVRVRVTSNNRRYIRGRNWTRFVAANGFARNDVIALIMSGGGRVQFVRVPPLTP